MNIKRKCINAGIIGVILLLSFCKIYAQYPKSRVVIIKTKDTICEVSILVNKKPDLKINKKVNYHWFAFNQIHVNQGAYSGQLVHGTYKVYNSEYNLVESGSFNKGVKYGEWTQWDKEGRIITISKWDKGKLNGILKRYIAGHLSEETAYKNGIKHGKSIIYTNGEVNKVVYKNGEKVLPKIKKGGWLNPLRLKYKQKRNAKKEKQKDKSEKNKSRKNKVKSIDSKGQTKNDNPEENI